jgi:DNA invertase Pin-like site-specific DNA recombinase
MDSEDRQVLSLDSQENELRTIATKAGLNIIKVFKESRTAKEQGRPIFNEVVHMIQSGKADAILCWKLDRLARNFLDGGLIMDMLQKGVIKEIRTYEAVHLPNESAFIMAMQFGMSTQFSRDLSVNVKRGNRAKLEKGGWPHMAPIGYLNDKATKTILVDPKKALYIKRAYELYATGAYGLKEVADTLYKEGLRTPGGRKVFFAQIHRMLTRKFYLGLMEDGDKVYKGNHPALIDQKTYDAVQEVVHGRLHSRKRNHFYSARGFLTCGVCGCIITAETQKGFSYYHCTNGKGVCDQKKNFMRSELIDSMLAKVFLDLKFNEEFIDISYNDYKDRYGSKIDYEANIINNLKKELDGLSTKESMLTDSYSSQVLRKDLYEEKMRDIANKRIELEKQIEENQKKSGVTEVTFEQIRNVFIDGSRATEQYKAANDDAKRLLLQKLLSNATIKNKSVAQYQFKSPYQVLANTPKNIDISQMCG